MKIALYALLCLSASLVNTGCTKRIAKVPDPTKTEILLLKKRPAQGLVHGLEVYGTADIDGEARVQLILDGSIYKEEKVKGSTKFHWGGDWYSDQAEVRYVPLSVRKGAVHLAYDFKD